MGSGVRPSTANRTGRNNPAAAIHVRNNINKGKPAGRQWAILLATNGLLHARQWAGSHGRRHDTTATPGVRAARINTGGWVTRLSLLNRRDDIAQLDACMVTSR